MTLSALRRGPAERVIVDLQIDDQTREQTLNTGHPVFQGLSNMRFFLAGSLEETALGDGEEGNEAADDGITRTPLK